MQRRKLLSAPDLELRRPIFPHVFFAGGIFLSQTQVIVIISYIIIIIIIITIISLSSWLSLLSLSLVVIMFSTIVLPCFIEGPRSSSQPEVATDSSY